MSRIDDIDIWYDDHTVLIGDAVSTKETFDDERGALTRAAITVENLRVIVYIKGMDYDVTPSFTQKQLWNFEEYFCDQVREKYFEDTQKGETA